MLLKGNTMVPDNVVDVFIMIVIASPKKKPYPYKRDAAIMRPLALLIWKQDHTGKVALMMMEDACAIFLM